MILCDTGVMLCVVDQSQALHKSYVRAFEQLPMPFMTTWACMTEAMYLAERCGGYPLQCKLGMLLKKGVLQIYEIQVGDYDRLFGLIEQYRDRPMDFADATLVVAAERMGTKQILTIDSDFLFYRINESESFEIVTVE